MPDDQVTITPKEGPRDPAPEQTIAQRDPDFDYNAQDPSQLTDYRQAELQAFDCRFVLSEPRSHEEAMGLIEATDDAELLARRSLSILVAEPEPLAPFLEEMTPYQQMIVATTALEWVGITRYIEEAQSIDQLRDRIAAAFGEDPPTG